MSDQRVYRVYAINEQGHFAGSTVITAESDDEAKLIARRMRDDADLELWDGVRLVAKLDHKSSDRDAIVFAH